MKATVTHIAQMFPTNLPALVTNKDGEIVLAIPTPTYVMPSPADGRLFYFVGLVGGLAGQANVASKCDFVSFNGSVTLSN